jgi:hypothetical protein
MCGGGIWSAGRPGKTVPRCGKHSVRLATRNAVRPASLLLWCPGATDRGRTGTLGAVRELGRTAEVSRKVCRSRWRRWCREFVASLTAGLSVFDAGSVRSSSSLSCDAASVPRDGGTVTD